MKTITSVLSALALTTAVGTVAAVVFGASHAESKKVESRSAADSDILLRRQIASRNAEVRMQKPAVDCYFSQDYAGALRKFDGLKGSGDDFGWKRSMCLLHLGKPREALNALTMSKTFDRQDFYDYRAMLAIACHDESVLLDSVRHAASLRALADSPDRTHSLRETNLQTSSDRRKMARDLMAIACAFGAKYDYESLNLVAQEAMRRGATDVRSLMMYASQCRSNGELPSALALYKRAEAQAKGRDRFFAQADVYDMENMITLYARLRPIEEEVERGHARDRQFNRRFWIGDPITAKSSLRLAP